MKQIPELKIDFMTAAQALKFQELMTGAFENTPTAHKVVENMMLHRYPPPENFDFTQNDHYNVTLLAHYRDQIIGGVCCSVFSTSKESKMYSIGMLFVDKDHRNLGIGTALMKRAEKFITKELLKEEAGWAMLMDGTKAKNPESQYYERMGYITVKEAYGDSAPEEPDPNMPTLMKRLEAPAAPSN